MDFTILSIILLAIGIYGLLFKRGLLKIVISIELIATAASMNFVLLASALNRELGQAFLIIAFATDTSITAIVLSLLITISKKYGTLDTEKLAELEDDKESNSDDA